MMPPDDIQTMMARLRAYNQWRRGAEMIQPDPRQIGQDLDDALDLIERMRAAITATITENGHLADGDDCTLRHLTRLDLC